MRYWGNGWIADYGDMREVLRQLPENSIDSVCTDPPYALSFMGRGWDSFATPGAFQKQAQHWGEACLRVMKPGAHGAFFSAPRTEHRLVCALEDAGFEIRDKLMWLYGSGFPKSHNLKGAWKGWGTALKPAWEPIVLVRKPFKDSTQRNAIRYGTGALNIDACRVPVEGADDIHAKNPHTVGGFGHADALVYWQGGVPRKYDPTQGRWPANLLLDEAAGAILDADAGPVSGQRGRAKTDGSELTRTVYDGGRNYASANPEPRGDAGGPSRFFYQAKASKKEREAGLEAFVPTNVNDGRETSIDNPYQRGDTLRKNTCPTVKPIALMRWLCTLITPPGGVVLDPFCGSGSTGAAAVSAGFRAYLIDADFEHFRIACARVAHWRETT